jgi:PAS domain S-box-containing protein
MTVDQILQWVGMVATAATSIYTIWKYIVKPVKKAFIQVANTYEAVQSMEPVVRGLQKEFSNNAGKSIKDRIEKLAVSMKVHEARHKTVLDHAAIGIFEAEPSGMFTYANRTMSDWFEMDQSAMVGNGWLAAVSPDERDGVYTAWKDAITNDIPWNAIFTVHPLKGGVPFCVHATASVVRDVDGRVLRFCGTTNKVAGDHKPSG